MLNIITPFLTAICFTVAVFFIMMFIAACFRFVGECMAITHRESNKTTVGGISFLPLTLGCFNLFVALWVSL